MVPFRSRISMVVSIVPVAVIPNERPETDASFTVMISSLLSNGASNLDMKQQLVHMLVHHGQVPVSSSIIIATIVGLSVFLAGKIK